jgi:hypothetical protein
MRRRDWATYGALQPTGNDFAMLRLLDWVSRSLPAG